MDSGMISKIQKAIKAYGATAQSAGVTESGLTFSDMIPDYRHGNAVEAVIGASFLDAGFEAAHGVVRTLFASALEQVPR